VEVAIYADVTPKQLMSTQVRDVLASFERLDALHVNVHSSTGKWRWDSVQWMDAVNAFPLRLRPVGWPKPGEAGAEAVRQLNAWGRDADTFPVLDLEHQWLKAPMVADHMIVRASPEARITTHFNHPIVRADRGRGRLVARTAGSLEIQALSVSKRDGKPVPLGSPLAPPQMQLATAAMHSKIRDTTGGRERAGGDGAYITLPAYKQVGFGVQPIDAMRAALSACVEAGAAGVSYWSLRHVLKNQYALRFIRDVLPELV
jgi:hypothetical protein